MVLALSCAHAGAADYPTATTYVDGKRVDFYSQILNQRIPCLLVEGHAMLPARFVAEALGDELDIHLMQWGIVSLGPLDFKLGEKKVLRCVPAIGGNAAAGQPLPIAPRTIEGRVYVPAAPTLTFLGHTARWESEGRILRIERRKQGEGYGFP